MWNQIQVVGMDASLLAVEKQAYACITDVFIGNKCLRYGCRPSAEHCQHLERVLSRRCETAEPIRVVTPWGSNKGYGGFAPVREADLLDLMALKRFAALDAHAREHGAAGVRVSLLWEDLTERILTGHRSQVYHETLTRLIRAAGLDFVEIVKESACIEDEVRFRETGMYYACKIEDGKEGEIGWRGQVPWSHYLRRSLSECPDKSEADRCHDISTYLGLALARHQLATLPPSDVRLSFCPYPSTVPDAMRRGRLEWKVKPARNSHRTAAPWTGFGVLRDGGADWSHVSLPEVRAARFEVGQICVNGVSLPTLTNTENRRSCQSI